MASMPIEWARVAKVFKRFWFYRVFVHVFNEEHIDLHEVQAHIGQATNLGHLMPHVFKAGLNAKLSRRGAQLVERVQIPKAHGLE